MYSIDLAAQEIRASEAVVVLGAGVSFAAGMPLAGQLSPLVWHALDSNTDVLKSLCEELSVSVDGAKAIVSDDPVRISRAFRLIKDNKAAYRTFKESLCDLDNSRITTPSRPHTALARLLHAGKVIEIISFNWDTLLERAFEKRFGFQINNQGIKLWKPHGDCRKPEQEWVLPFEQGMVPAALVEQLSNLASVRPRILLIIGYSERDAAVVQQLIEPLANRWRVFRVSPSATGEGAIHLPAGEALERLAEQLATTPDIPGWSIVTFDNQRGIEAAIAGERLGPRDVEACPRLPHFNAALEKLALLHSVEIAGDSGSGKSITIWQLAHKFHRRGWQVLRHDAAHNPISDDAIDALRSQTWRTVAVVDDSQVLPIELTQTLRDVVGENLKIIFGTTDPKGEQRQAVRTAARVAVETLANHFRAQRTAILPIVQQFDSYVGDGFLDVRIERRIDDAAMEDSPWQFAYVLRGGTRKVHDLLNAARDFDHSDLLLVLIAARQLATLDAGSSVIDLMAEAQKLGRDEAWVRQSLNVLSRQRAILVSGDVRCLHLKSAGSIIEASLEMRKGTDYVELLSLHQNILKNPSLPLRGISWLLHCFWRHEKTVVGAEIKSELVSRCFAARKHLEIRDACFVLERLLGRRDKAVLAQVLANRELLHSWIIGADLTDAYALGGAINNIHNDSPSEGAALLGGIDPKVIAAKIGAASPTSGYIWGNFISRLCVGKERGWRDAVASHLPREAMRRAVATVSSSQSDELPKYIEGVAGFDFDFGLELFEIATPILRAAIQRDSLGTFRELFDASLWLLGEGLFLDGKPTKRQRAISRHIFEGLDPEEVIGGILSCPFGEWENYSRLLSWVRRAHPSKHRAIAKAMNWAALEEIVGDKFEKPGREFSLLLVNLVSDPRSGEPVRSWLLRHAKEMKEIGSRIVVLSPEAACNVLNNGGTINLARDHVSWLMDAIAIGQIARLDETAAKQVVKANVPHLAKGVAELSFPEDMPELLKLLSGAPELLEEILNSVDVARAKERWPIALVDHRPNERKGAREVLGFISARNSAELGQLAGRLKRDVRYRKRSVAEIKPRRHTDRAGGS
jgi:hypothetical protein